MTTTNNIPATENLSSFARGIGALKNRMGVRKQMAIQYAVTEYPQLAGLEAEIAAGWTRGYNERRGR